MTALVAHNEALRKMRRLAKERNCFVLCAPTGIACWDNYSIVDDDTGETRGVLRAYFRKLTTEAVTTFFAEEVDRPRVWCP